MRCQSPFVGRAAKEIESGQFKKSAVTDEGTEEVKAKIERLLDKFLGSEERDKIEAMSKQLSMQPLEKLYFLKMTDACGGMEIDCGDMTTEKVKPLIDIELERRKAVLDETDKRHTFYISIGSLVVAFLAFGLSVVGFFRNRPA